MKICKRKHPLYFILFAVILVAMLTFLSACGDDPVEVIDATFTVPDDYSTIQDAINAAEHGDIIVVRPGQYNESINFNGKNITLRSVDPEDPEIVGETIIDAGGVNSVVVFREGEGEGAVISGFTITGGSGNMEILEFEMEGEMREVPSLYGGGILILNGSSPTITNNVITDNVAERGGGLLSYGSSPVIEGNRFSDNFSTGGGGGLFIANSSATVSSNQIANNSAGRSGGGIAVSGEGEGNTISIFDGNTVSGNRAEHGAAFSIFESNPNVTNNIVINNSANNIGGGFYIIRSSPVLTGNDISDNRAGSFGGGVAIFFESSPLLEDNLIIGNEADTGGGVAIYINSSPRVEGNTISDNRARLGGGLLVNDGSDPEIVDNMITENYAERNGAGIFVQASSPIIDGNTFRNNEARRDGAGIYAIVDAVVTVINNVFENNRASGGGAMYATEGSSFILGSPDENTYQGNVPDDIYQD